MNWIRVATNIVADSSINNLADALDILPIYAVGHVVGVFAQMSHEDSAGDVSRVSDSLLERWAHWPGERGAFGRAFRAQLCTPEGVVRSWDKYNGAALRALEHSRKRKQEWREAKRAGQQSDNHDVPGTSPGQERGRPRSKVGDSDGTSPVTRQDKTGQDRTNNKQQTATDSPTRHGEPELALVPEAPVTPPPSTRRTPRWPDWPVAEREALWQHWRAHMGGIEFPRFVASAGLTLGDGLPDVSREELTHAWRQCVEIGSVASESARFLRDPRRIGGALPEAIRIFRTNASVGDQLRQLQLLLHGKAA